MRSGATLARETPPAHVDSRFRGNDMVNLWGRAGQPENKRPVPKAGASSRTPNAAGGCL